MHASVPLSATGSISSSGGVDMQRAESERLKVGDVVTWQGTWDSNDRDVGVVIERGLYLVRIRWDSNSQTSTIDHRDMDCVHATTQRRHVEVM